MRPCGGFAAYDAEADREPIPGERDDPAPTGVGPSTEGVGLPGARRRVGQSPVVALQVPEQENAAPPSEALDAPVAVHVEEGQGAKADQAGAGCFSRPCRASLTSNASAVGCSSGDGAGS